MQNVECHDLTGKSISHRNMIRGRLCINWWRNLKGIWKSDHNLKMILIVKHGELCAVAQSQLFEDRTQIIADSPLA